MCFRETPFTALQQGDINDLLRVSVPVQINRVIIKLASTLWLIAQLLLLLPNRRTVSLHCRDGSTLPAHENACVYFAFPASFFRPFKVYTNFTEEAYSYFYTVNNCSSVPTKHGLAATLAYVNRELTNTLVSLVSPRGPYRREEEHPIRYYSGGLGQRFRAIPSALGWTWLLG